MRARQLLALAGLFFALGTPSAAALEVRLWPLVDYEEDAGATRLRLLGPLFEWTRRSGGSAFSLRPLLRIERRDDRTEGLFLYPLATWTRTPDRFFTRLAALASYEARERAGAVSLPTRELTVFPFVFFRQNPATGTSLSVLPFYADLTGVLGYERIRMFLFPLWLRLEEPLHRRTWLPFPFVSVASGPIGRGFRLWPLWGRTVVGRQSETRYVAWPFWIRHVAHPGHPDQVTTRISWPLFSLVDGPRLTSRTWGYLLVLPLWTHTVDRTRGTVARGFPWPFWVTERDLDTGKRRSIRLTPFFQDRRTESLRSVFILWPAWRLREGLGDAAGFRRTDVFFFVWRDEYEGEWRTRVLFPLWRSVRSREGYDGQSLTWIDGIFPTNTPLRTLWAPLWRLWGVSDTAGGFRHEILWGLVGWDDDGIRPPLSLSFD